MSTFGRLAETSAGLERRLGRSLEQHCEIPHSWFEVLVRISRTDGGLVSMGALAEQLVLTSGGVTRLVDRMSETGYVERLPCPSDRRVNYVALTDAGRAKLDEALEVHRGNLREAFATLGDAEVATLDILLDRLRSADRP